MVRRLSRDLSRGIKQQASRAWTSFSNGWWGAVGAAAAGAAIALAHRIEMMLWPPGPPQ